MAHILFRNKNTLGYRIVTKLTLLYKMKMEIFGSGSICSFCLGIKIVAFSLFSKFSVHFLLRPG
jgi:hypothetical protein